jgi:hypothetical protein
MQASLLDPMEGVRRNSAFCIGVLVETTGTALSQHFMHFLGWLHPLCTRHEAQQASDVGGADIDNAISSVARMINVAQALIPLDQVLPVMLASLPLRSDHSEGENIYGCFSRLVLSGDATALRLLPQILESFAQVVSAGSKSSDETKAVVKTCVAQLSSGPQLQPVYVSALGQCSSDTVHLLENLLRST